MKKTLAALAAGSTLALGGCLEDPEQFSSTGTYNGHPTQAWVDASFRRVRINSDKEGERYFVLATDSRNVDGNYDGGFDEMKVFAPANHPLRQFASFDVLEKAYSEVKANGKRDY